MNGHDPKQPHIQDDPEQSKRFIEAAKKAEADESDEGAQRAFKKVTRPPKDRQKNESN